MKKSYVILILALLLLLPGAASAADETPSSGGILEAITDFLFGWLTPDPAPPAQTDDPFAAAGTQSDAPGTDLIVEPTAAPTPEDNQTITPTPTPTPVPVLGTVYAVDYRTSPPYGSAPFMVRFTVANVTPGESVLWDFGDGHHSTEYDHWHTYEAAGTYTATLTRGDNTSASIAIQVEPPGVVPLPEDEEMMF